MGTLYLFCAIFGGTVLVAQFFLGFGGEDHGSEGSEDAPDDVGAMDAETDGCDGHHDAGHHDSTWVFGVLTFRTMLIGLTFFGLTGKATGASGFDPPQTLLIALGCGLAAMYGVYFLMRGLYKLTAEGTERIARAIGEEATVYLAIPGGNQGVGKVHMVVQNRTMEYEATTVGQRLPTGTRVVVVGVLGSDRVEVEPIVEPTNITEPARNSNV